MKITKVRIEYEDGSAREVEGTEECAKWEQIADGQAGLWASRGWPLPEVRWTLIPAPTTSQSGT